jgi:urease accessory protein
MLRAVTHLLAQHSPENAVVCGVVTLSYHDRHRRRLQMHTDGGMAFLLDLPQATYLQDGDYLALEDGRYVRIAAACEHIMDVTAATPEALARLAWHVGNRHTPVQVLDGGVLRMAYDHVLDDMVQGLGGCVCKGIAAFSPEPGAYHSHKMTTAEDAHAHH